MFWFLTSPQSLLSQGDSLVIVIENSWFRLLDCTRLVHHLPVSYLWLAGAGGGVCYWPMAFTDAQLRVLLLSHWVWPWVTKSRISDSLRLFSRNPGKYEYMKAVVHLFSVSELMPTIFPIFFSLLSLIYLNKQKGLFMMVIYLRLWINVYNVRNMFSLLWMMVYFNFHLI